MMMNTVTRLSVAILLLLTAPRAYTQVSIKWFRTYDNQQLGHRPDDASAMAIDSSGNGIYVTGSSFGNEDGQGEDYLTIKYDSSGNKIWERRYDGPSKITDKARDIAIDPSGNVIVTGSSNDSSGGYKMATIKYDAMGNLLWAARFGVAGLIGVHGDAMELDSKGNIYVTGTGGFDSTDNDFITVKYDPAGNHVWTAVYDGPKIMGDRPKDIKLDALSNVYVVGWSSSDTVWSNSYSGSAYTTIKYDNNGNQVWVKRFNGSEALSSSNAMDVDSEGNVYVTGQTRNTNSGDFSDIATIKYNTAGVEQWKATFEGTGGGQDHGDFIKVDNEGNVYVFGGSVSDPNAAFPQTDYILIKYNFMGVEQWARYYTPLPTCGSCQDVAEGLALDNAGNIYITGSSTMDLPFMTFRDYVTARYSPQGTQQWVDIFDGVGHEQDNPKDIKLDHAGNVYVTGFSKGLNSLVNNDYLTIKYGQNVSPTNIQHTAEMEAVGMSVFPNPFSTVTTIGYTLAEAGHVTIAVYDMLGSRITTLINERQSTGSYKAVLSAEGLVEGIYFITLTMNGMTITKKISYIK